jgi:hypothetical protein
MSVYGHFQLDEMLSVYSRETREDMSAHIITD